MTQKFKVGDEVRILDVRGIRGAIRNGFKDGDYAVVFEVSSAGFYIKRYDGITIGLFPQESKYVELVTSISKQYKSKKAARISALEQQVAELVAKVVALESTLTPTTDKIGLPTYYEKATLELSPNEQRKAIIAEAKSFVDAQFFKGNYDVGNVVGKYQGHNKVEFVINSENSTVEALLRLAYCESNKVIAKGIAKYTPDDVFNVDIWKAIALGRALGLDVSKFEQAIKPTEFTAGQVIALHTLNGARETKKLSRVVGKQLWSGVSYITSDRAELFAEADPPKIIEDTDAQY